MKMKMVFSVLVLSATVFLAACMDEETTTLTGSTMIVCEQNTEGADSPTGGCIDRLDLWTGEPGEGLPGYGTISNIR